MENKKRIEFIFCLLVIWSAVIIQSYALLKDSGEEKTVEAFQTLNLTSIKGNVEVSAQMNKINLNQKEKQNVLKEMAAELGIESGYQMKDNSTEDVERMTLEYEMESETVRLSITNIQIPMDDGNYKQNQYVYAECGVEKDLDRLLVYKLLLEKILNRRGLKPFTNINLQGEKEGYMSMEEKKEVTDRLFHSLEAKEVEAVREDDLYTVYGYSNLLKDSITYGENEINLNLAFTYNEGEEKTSYYLAMPYIHMDY